MVNFEGAAAFILVSGTNVHNFKNFSMNISALLPNILPAKDPPKITLTIKLRLDNSK